MKFENDKGEPVEVNFHNFERVIPDGKAGRLHPREVHRQFGLVAPRAPSGSSVTGTTNEDWLGPACYREVFREHETNRLSGRIGSATGGKDRLV